MSFPRYPEYKDSGVEWLGEVPVHWAIPKLKHVANIRNGRDYKEVETEDDNGYPVIGSGGQFSRATGYLYSGESVLLGRKGTIDRPLYINGSFWTVDTMFYTELSSGIDGRFLFYYATTFPFGLYSTNTALPSMAQEDLANLNIAVPKAQEQRQIAAFLDHETGKIDALIEEQRRLIELLKEKRQALVLRLRGDPDSRFERLENVVELVSRPVEQQSGKTYIPIGLFNRGRGLFKKEAREKSEMGDSDFFWVKNGDLIISGQFAWEGAIALVGESEDGCVVSHRYPVIRGAHGDVLTEYIFALLSTGHGNFLLNENSRGAAGRNRPLNINSLLKEDVWVPSLLIQQEVAEIVRKERVVQAELEEQKDLLLQRRSALISSAVTGKIDVRGWSAGAEAEEPGLAMVAEDRAEYLAQGGAA